MELNHLYGRVKEEYRDFISDYIKKYKASGELMREELTSKEYVSRLTYACIVYLQDATHFSGSPFALFKEIENDL